MSRLLRSAPALLALAIAAPALADLTFTMQNGNGGGGEFNTVAFSITNNAAPGVQLTQFSLTIGDPQYLFDFLYSSEETFLGGDGTQAAALLLGNRDDDNAGDDLFTYGFTNFAPGVTFRGQWDIDNDNLNFNADARQVLFNNGALPNAVATFTFSDGSVITYTFPDLPVESSYTLVIPAPGAAALLALLPLAARRRR